MYYSFIDVVAAKSSAAPPSHARVSPPVDRRCPRSNGRASRDERQPRRRRRVCVHVSRVVHRARFAKPEASRCRRHVFPSALLAARRRRRATRPSRFPRPGAYARCRSTTMTLIRRRISSATCAGATTHPSGRRTPVLNDEQRKRVGTLYKQVDPFEAKGRRRARGGESSDIIEERFMAWRTPTNLVYCWRGGERSLSLAHVLVGLDSTYTSPRVGTSGTARACGGCEGWMRFRTTPSLADARQGVIRRSRGRAHRLSTSR